MAEEKAIGSAVPEGQLSPEEVKAIGASFVGKCCPLGLIGLSISGAQTQGALVSPLGQKVSGGGELVGCQGPTCMWFRIIKAPPQKLGEQPKAIGGDCCVSLLLGSVSALPEHMGGVLAQLGKFRFTPNGG